LSPILTDKPQI